MNKWKNDSEYLAGLILTDKLSPDVINPEALCPPYSDLVRMKRLGLTVTEMMVKGAPFVELDGALNAGRVANPGDSFAYIKAVELEARLAIGGARLRKQVEKMERGEEPDYAIIAQVASDSELGKGDLVPMSEVEPAGNMYMKTGYEPFDTHFGGVPMASMTILAASPGVGKTSLALKLAKGSATLHKDKFVAIFTLEMTMGQITKRALELEGGMTTEQKSRILLNEDILNAQELYAIASRASASRNLSLIIIDFADQMVQGEQSEAVMGDIYRTMAALAKRTGVPVLLVAQLNRETYTGGIPKINHIRYSGLAEAVAAMILLVYNPHSIFVDAKSQEILPALHGFGWVIVGKSRYGYVHGGPCAAQIPWDGLSGWGEKSEGYRELGG